MKTRYKIDRASVVVILLDSNCNRIWEPKYKLFIKKSHQVYYFNAVFINVSIVVEM